MGSVEVLYGSEECVCEVLEINSKDFFTMKKLRMSNVLVEFTFFRIKKIK